MWHAGGTNTARWRCSLASYGGAGLLSFVARACKGAVFLESAVRLSRSKKEMRRGYVSNRRFSLRNSIPGYALPAMQGEADDAVPRCLCKPHELLSKPSRFGPPALIGGGRQPINTLLRAGGDFFFVFHVAFRPWGPISEDEALSGSPDCNSPFRGKTYKKNHHYAVGYCLPPHPDTPRGLRRAEEKEQNNRPTQTGEVYAIPQQQPLSGTMHDIGHII